MQRRLTTFTVLLVLIALSAGYCQAGDPPQPKLRSVATKVTPMYPDTAKRMRLEGTVRVEATVAPNGTVRLTKVLGGHPVLAQASDAAVLKWRWEPAHEESTEVVELHFHP